MKIYNKRIMFMISSQHLIPHGGLGSFAKSFTEMANDLNWQVDLVLDKKPMHKFHEVVRELGVNIIYPDEPLLYDQHQGTYAFADCINFEQIANFRRSMLVAFTQNIYDMVVCNTQESMSAAYSLDLGKYIPIVFYTHQPGMVTREQKNKDVFLEPYHEFYNKHLEFKGITVGTQSERNKTNLHSYGAKEVEVLPMPMSERGLLEFNTGPREGVLYIGRYEPRKNPEAFIQVIKETGLSAKIMTNSNGAKKFKAQFEKYGITNYEIATEIVGEEKVNFIKGCKLHYNPSFSENYPFVFYECLTQLTCVVNDVQDWADNFDSQYYTVTTQKNAAKVIAELYEQDVNDAGSKYIASLHKRAENKWEDFLNNFVSKTSSTNAAKINQEHTTKYRDFIEKLNRNFVSQEDIVSVLSNRHKFAVKYTKSDTWLSKDPQFVPVADSNPISLFEGL
jgi:glycosyltransferase involved in cell wall biosynthesis